MIVDTSVWIDFFAGRDTWQAGLLARELEDEQPVGLTDIILRFEVDCDADPAKLERMIQTTERYCVILQTLRNAPRITVSNA